MGNTEQQSSWNLLLHDMTDFVLHTKHQIWKWWCSTKSQQSEVAQLISTLLIHEQWSTTWQQLWELLPSTFPWLQSQNVGSEPCVWATQPSLFPCACGLIKPGCREGVAVLTEAALSQEGQGTLAGEIPMKFTFWNNFLQWAWNTVSPTLCYDLETPFCFCRNKMKVFLVSDFCG